MSFSGVALFCFVLFRFRLFAFTEAAALLRSVVLRSSICMRPDSHTQLPNNCLRSFSFLLLSFSVSSEMMSGFFPSGYVPYYSFLCMESTSYVFPFRMMLFYLVTTGWIFYVRIQAIIQAITKSILSPGLSYCDDITCNRNRKHYRT